MIKLEKTDVVGWEPAIRGMRNPMNSWDKSDSWFQDAYNCEYEEGHAHDILGQQINYDNDEKEDLYNRSMEIGPADHDLMMRLAKAGSVDAKFRRMIVVYVDITAPLYWWKEFDTYKVGTVANSCSTMHKIQAKEFVREDFSLEHLGEPNLNLMDMTIRNLNIYRDKFLETKSKEDWWQMIQVLPSTYNQKRTVMLNYEVLAGIYPKRRNHKLDEWHEFCQWIEWLPYSEIITLKPSIFDEEDPEKITWGMVFKDFKERFPEYCNLIEDYRPAENPFTIRVWLNKTNALVGSRTLIYDYQTKKVSYEP